MIAAVVLLGLLLLLLWKAYTKIIDKREYAKFENDRLKAKWDAVSMILFIPS